MRVMRAIRNNPFKFDTKDKPFGIVGRSSSIMKVISRQRDHKNSLL